MFCLNEKVVYSGHGVAKIHRIIEKVVAGSITLFYELKFLHKDMTILVPVDSGTGMRPLSADLAVEELFGWLSEPSNEATMQDIIMVNWNRRNKEYQAKFRTGHLKDLAEIYRELRNIAQYKELSFGEKSLLHQTELLLAEEISLIKQWGYEKTVEYLRVLCGVIKKHVGHSRAVSYVQEYSI